jgi:methionine sulfoxide reductase heme-binding subunit
LNRPALLHPAVRPGLHLLCALPLGWLVYALFTQQLGANPAEALIRGLGDWGLRGLLLTLAITPLRVLIQQPLLVRYRRLFGLWSFVYVLLHLLAYTAFDKGFDVNAVVTDVIKRPFILVGMLAFVLLVPLAATSFNAAQRWLGGKRWQALHRLVYLIAVLGCLHFWWMRMGKNLWVEPAIYAGLFALLLGWRLMRATTVKRRAQTAAP